MIFSKFSRDGYICSDNRVTHEGIQEFDTLGCNHCGSHVIPNPDRRRSREWCSTCDSYICDWCGMARKEAGYVHRTIQELDDLLKTGKWALSGTMSKPVLVPIS